MPVRKAILPDANAIDTLIRAHTGDGTLLPRSFQEICADIRDFVVAELDGQIVGCGALHLYGMHLAEIRSINVLKEYRSQKLGVQIVHALMEEAKHQHVTCVCLFTRVPEFFGSLGFREADRDRLPDKVYKDCLKCPRNQACDEVAMYRGELPALSHMPKGYRPSDIVRIAPAQTAS
ncbi:MAG TPA: N-acetyltransferase [Candidatus Koribacter sp.]|jgi:amino-acid N-acetyltransferase